MELNIVELIENNPMTKLSQNYNGKLLNKLKTTFNEFEQQLFVTSFYCYLNYNYKTDFVIDLNNIWTWLGFSQKDAAKRLLEKQFVIDTDYKIFTPHECGSKKGIGRGGHNKEIIMLNVKTFKSFCLKAGTKKADEIHEYFIKMEEIIQESVNEESNELKLQLETNMKELQNTKQELEKKTEQIENIQIKTQLEKDKLLEATLISQFPVNTQCIYYGKIDNKTLGKESSKMYHESLIKFGQSNNLAERITSHKKNFTNFRLIAAFKVQNKIEIENCIKRHPILKKRMRTIIIENANYKDENYRELLALDEDNFTIEKIDEFIKEIIKENQYNIENYNLLVEKNFQLENELRNSRDENKEKDEQIEKLTKELHKHTSNITEISKKKTSTYAICKYGYNLYAFECEPMRYKCSISIQKDFEQLTTNLKHIDSTGEMKYVTKVSYPFSEKIMAYLLKQTMTNLETNKYEGSYETIKKVLDITVKIENMLMNNWNDLEKLSDLLDGNVIIQSNEYENPEEPKVHKAARPVDQINKQTGEIIATHESIEAAGRALGLTTGTAIGIALREKRTSRGFLWRYHGISKEEQYMDQPVVKVCCSTGEKKYFDTIADAGRDVGISAPGIRNRILTNVHVNGHHWIFDKTSTHYTSS